MLSVKDISKIYHNADGDLKSLEDISFEVNTGELVTVFGPNGSGKTTLFNIISGLDKYNEGEVLFDGLNQKDIETNNIGFVFQNYNDSLFPWLSVLDNILIVLDAKNIPREISLEKAEKVLKKVNLWEHRNKYLYQLSGGMRQLVAICRAFVIDPEYLLMDEPCSALDYTTTKKVELEILKLWEEKKITTLVISHDVDEAIFLADKVIVLSPRPGKVKKIIDVDLPRPRKLDMFGSPEFFQIRKKVLESFIYE